MKLSTLEKFSVTHRTNKSKTPCKPEKNSAEIYVVAIANATRICAEMLRMEKTKQLSLRRLSALGERTQQTIVPGACLLAPLRHAEVSVKCTKVHENAK